MKDILDRHDPDIEAEIPPEDLPAAATSLELDLDKYRPYLAEFDLTDEQAAELLQTLWSIMRSFAELGFGVDSVHTILAKRVANSSVYGANALKSDKAISRNHFEMAAAIPAEKRT